MIKMVGKAARNSYLVAFFNSLKKEDDRLETTVKELLSYSMPIIFNENTVIPWEKWLGLSEESSWTLQDRIERILYTLNSNQTCTEKFLIDQAKIFTNGEIEIDQQFSFYNFIIQFTSSIGSVPNLENFKQMVELNKPAHLTCEIKLRYRTHKELKPYTHEELSKYTHTELRARGKLNKLKGGKNGSIN